MVHLEPHAEGIVIDVRAQPGSRRSGIRGEQDGMLKVGVTQIAEKGKANKALLAVLCDELDLRNSQVALLSGETSQRKQVLVRGIERAELAQRIATALAATSA